MTWGAYVFGDLSWPMPDLGLVAVWRAMPLDASRWGDWDGFVDEMNAGTIAALLDKAPGASSFKLELDENGAKLRAYIEDADADWWRRLAIAWRAAADLGASGEFAWVPGDSAPVAVAYHGVIGDYDSRWEKRDAAAVEHLAGRKEIDAMIGATPRLRAPTPVPEPIVEPEVVSEAHAIEDDKAGRLTRPTPKKRAPTKRAAPRKVAAKKAGKKKR